MTQTLRRELRTKFEEVLEEYYQDNPPTEDARIFNEDVAGKLADAALSVAGITKQTDEEPGKYGIGKDLFDAMEKYERPAQTIREAIKQYFRINISWETKYPREWMEWAVGEQITPDQIRNAAERWRSDELFNWTVPTLKGIFEKWALLIGEPARKEIEEFESL